MHGDDPPGNRQPKPRTTLCRGGGAISLLELFVDLTLVGGIDAGSSVAHGEGISSIANTGFDCNLTRIGEFDGVADEIKQNLAESPLVPVSGGQAIWQFDLERQALFSRQGFDESDHVLNEVLDRIILKQKRELPSLDLR